LKFGATAATAARIVVVIVACQPLAQVVDFP